MLASGAEYAASKFACISVSETLKDKHSWGLFIQLSLF
jgi:hypothetical protein